MPWNGFAEVFLHILKSQQIYKLKTSCAHLWLQNIYWSDSGDLVAIASDNSFYILKYNVSCSPDWCILQSAVWCIDSPVSL